VTVIDVASEKPIKSIKTGRYPWGVVSSLKPISAASQQTPQQQ
jgi:hypothetical protein